MAAGYANSILGVTALLVEYDSWFNMKADGGLATSVTPSPSSLITLYPSSDVISNAEMTSQDLLVNSSSSLLLSMATKKPQTELSDCYSSSDWCGEDYDEYKVAVDVYLVLAVCVIGFLGNALTVAVLRSDNDPTNTTNWLLQSLAVTDTIYLLSAIVIQALKAINENTSGWPAELLRYRLPLVEPHFWAIASTAQTFAVWVVLLITVDRYLAVCRPSHKQLRSVQRARLAAACLLLAAVVYNIPRFLERRTELCVDQRLNVTRLINRHTDMRTNKEYFLIYKTIMYIILRSFGPLFVLLALNVNLVRTLRHVRRTTRRLSMSSRQRENVTLIITVVVGVFIVCQIPAVLVRIVFTVGEFQASLMPSKCLLKYVNAIANTLLTINSSVNFLIYCLIGRKFRAILADMCCCLRYCPAKLLTSSGNDPLLAGAADAVVPLQSYRIMAEVARSGFKVKDGGGEKDPPPPHPAVPPSASSSSSRSALLKSSRTGTGSDGVASTNGESKTSGVIYLR